MFVEICRVDVPKPPAQYVFSRKILEDQISRLKETIEQRAWYGVLGAPTSTVIALKDTSHLVTNLFLDGDKLVAEIEILETPNGEILKSLMADHEVAFKMCGVGNGRLDNQGNYIIADNYRLVQLYAEILSPKEADEPYVVFG